MATVPEQGTVKLEHSSEGRLSLRRNFAWTFVGNTIYAASSWGMLFVLAKLGTPVIVGQFALGLALTTPIILFASLQLRAIQATDTGYEYLFRDYFGLRLVMLGAALLAILGIVLVSSYSQELALTILVIGFGKTVDAISDVVYGLFQRHEQMNLISISLISKGLLSLVMLAVGQYLTHSVLWASVGWSLASVIIVVGYDLPKGVIILRRFSIEGQDKLVPRFHFGILRKLMWLALPLGITMMMISLNTSIPRYVIEHDLGTRELGFFSAIAYITVIGTTITNSLGQAATPRLANYYASKNDRLFRGLILKLVGIGILMGVAGVLIVIFAGRTILTLLYESEYAVYNDVFLWLMLAVGIGFIGSFLGYAITATREFTHFTVPYIAVTAIAALTSLILIPRFGLQGAALSSLLVSIANCITPFVIWSLIRRKNKNAVA